MATNEISLFKSQDGEVTLPVSIDSDTVWLDKDQIALLFGRDRSVVTRHISNVYKEHELEREGTCAKFAQVQIEGNREIVRQKENYNLDVIISVGYRIKSQRGVEGAPRTKADFDNLRKLRISSSVFQKISNRSRFSISFRAILVRLICSMIMIISALSSQKAARAPIN